MFLLQAFKDPHYFVYCVTTIIISICIHEFSHAAVAFWQGDDTAKKEGFFTINPLIQMNKVSLLCLLFFGMCWGACPVNKNKFKHEYSDALVAFAGPLSNFFLSVIFVFIGVCVSKYNNGSVFMQNLLYFCYIASYTNAVLGVFNLIPIAPLDGSVIAEFLFPKLRIYNKSMGMNGLFLLFALLTFIPQLNNILWGSGNLFINFFANMFKALINI